MAKFTVSFTQEYVRYSTASVDIEAANETDAADLAKQQVLIWTENTEAFDAGKLHIEVMEENGFSVNWSED